MSNQSPLRFFVSYSHKDESYKDDLTTHLSSLIRSGAIASWDDRQIPIGGEWDHEIKSEMNTADVIMLLISADFLNSNYCNDVEVTRAMERHHDPNDPATVVPIILRHCDWTDTNFAKLQALPKNAKPISTFQDKDEAYLYIVKQIKNLINSKNKPKSITTGSLPASNPKPVNVSTTTTESPSASKKTSTSTTVSANLSKNDIRMMIAEDETKMAIEAMTKMAKEQNSREHTTMLMLTSQFNRLSNNINSGIMKDSDINREKNIINSRLLDILNSKLFKVL